MNSPFEIVQASDVFRKKITSIANKRAGKKELRRALCTTYPVIGRLINTGFVRRSTLELFVKNLEGPDVNVEDYINKGIFGK